MPKDPKIVDHNIEREHQRSTHYKPVNFHQCNWRSGMPVRYWYRETTRQVMSVSLVSAGS